MSSPLATGEAITPFVLAVPPAELDDLRQRLARTRWPDPETVTDWTQGARLASVQALCAYWRDHYDWRRCEAQLNSWGQCKTTLDGLGIHFLHIRSAHPEALPLLMTHGWPGSVLEFHKVIGPLTDPTVHGGQASDAFHLVLPSLPGYGFSDKPTAPGWGLERIAGAWVTLMGRLGYGDRYVAQGGDWGAAVTGKLGQLRLPGCRAIHMNTVLAKPQPQDKVNPGPEARRALEKAEQMATHGSGYNQEQRTKPQTLGYGLADSPAGQAAWIYEKFQAWSDHPGTVEELLTRDEMLDDIMLYWLPNAATSAARLYWESLADLDLHVDLPVGISLFVNDISVAPREWAARNFSDLFYWNEVPKGGHFAAFEQPALFVAELRNCFRRFR